MAREPQPEELLSQFSTLFGDLFDHPEALARELRVELRVSFVDAVEGASSILVLTRTTLCRTCHGSCGAPGAKYVPCQGCGGTGGEEQTRGFLVIKQACPSCQGRRGTWSATCPDCVGRGAEHAVDRVTIDVPAGVREGQGLRLAGKGNDVADGNGPGDAIAVVSIEPDPRFAREGDDILVRADVPKAIARDGGSIEVTLPSGDRRVPVKPGQKSGDRLVMRGWGAVKLGSPSTPIASGRDEPYRSVDPSAHRGDLAVTFAVEGEPLPDELLTPAERDVRENDASDRRFFWASIAAVLVMLAIVLYALLTR